MKIFNFDYDNIISKHLKNRNDRLINSITNKSPLQRLIINVSVTILCLGIFFIISLKTNSIKGIVASVIVTPLLTAFSFYSYFKEKKNDSKFIDKIAEDKKERLSPPIDWQEKYLDYKMNVGFEKIKSPTMKSELLKKFRNRELFKSSFFLLFLSACGFISVCTSEEHEILFAIFTAIFACLSLGEWSLFFGSPVRRFYKENFDFSRIEKSFMNGKMLSHKNGGINFGTDYVVHWTNKEVYLIDLNMVENVTKKTVRVKKYEDSLYTGDEYRYYAVFDVRIPQSGKLLKPEIELNEFQVEMIIDEFKHRCYNGTNAKVKVSEKIEADISV